MKVKLPSVDNMRKRKATKRAAKKKKRIDANKSSVQEKSAPLVITSDLPPPPPFDIQPLVSKKRNEAEPSSLVEDVEARVTDKILDVLENVNILQDKEAALRASRSFNFLLDEDTFGRKSFTWLGNKSALVLGQAFQLHNIFMNKAAYKDKQAVLRYQELEEKLGKVESERDNKKRELHKVTGALTRSNEKVLNLDSWPRLEEEKVANLTKIMEAKDKDIEDIKEQLLDVHGTFSFKARLEAFKEFKLNKFDALAIDKEIRELEELLSPKESNVKVVKANKAIREDVRAKPLAPESGIEALKAKEQVIKALIIQAAERENSHTEG